MDVVIHPMAVSDFAFKPIQTKLKSNDTDEFIESVKERIYKTPKILKHIKEWNPNCFLISFKFENGLTNQELIDIAFESLFKNDSNLVISNDKQEMVENKKHISYFCKQPDVVRKIEGKEEIAREIFKIVWEL